MAQVIRSTGSLVKAYENSQAQIKRWKESSKAGIVRGMTVVTGLAGGASSGIVRGMGYAKLPGTEVDTDLALGAAAVAAGVLGMGGKKSSDSLVAFGLGMAAPAVSRLTEETVRNWKA